MLLALCPVGLASCSDDYAQPPVVLPEGGIGTGAWDNPMTAYQCHIGSINPEIAEPWVTGYIVGVVNTEIGTVLNERSAQFEAPFSINSNLLIALTPDETNWENCATVQLPSGSVRSALNLQDNPSALGRLVTIKGTTGDKYCGVYGLRSASDFNWGDKGKEPVELPSFDGPFFQNFEASTSFEDYAAQGWSNVMVSGGLSGWYLRNFDGNNYITVSAYKGSATGGPYENWLITPAIDMDKISEKTLEFVTQAAYAVENPEDCTLEVYALTSDNPKNAQMTKLNAQIAQPTGTSYTSWVNSGKIDLSALSGTIYIGWRYWSRHGGDGNSATYCVDNINVGNASEQPSTPDTPDTPEAGTIYSALGASDTSTDWTFDNVKLGSGITAIWSWKIYNGNGYLNASAYGSTGDSEAYAYSPAISLAGVTGASVEFEHAAKFQTSILTLGKFVVREAGTSAWTELDIPTWPAAGAWKFVSSGKIDISAFDGKSVEIGFKYGSNASGADTWEINNLKVTGTK